MSDEKKPRTTRVMVRFRLGGTKPGELDERTGIIYVDGRRSGGKTGPMRILSIHSFAVSECEAI